MADANKSRDEKIIKIIKDIHHSKQRADEEKIFLAAKDFTKDEVVSTLNKLCENKILKFTSRFEKGSYRFFPQFSEQSAREILRVDAVDSESEKEDQIDSEWGNGTNEYSDFNMKNMLDTSFDNILN